MEMIDGGETDTKLITVIGCDPRYKHINKLEDLSKHTLLEIRDFFENYKNLQDKTKSEAKRSQEDNNGHQLLGSQIDMASAKSYSVVGVLALRPGAYDNFATTELVCAEAGIT